MGAVILGILLMGNVMRCANYGNTKCPQWCAVRQVKCVSEYTDSCIQESCRAMDTYEYLDTVEEKFRSWFKK